MAKPLSIAMVSPEVDELRKRGGLADYTGSLARTLHAREHSVKVFIPGGESSEGTSHSVLRIHDQDIPVKVSHLTGGVPVYHVGNFKDIYKCTSSGGRGLATLPGSSSNISPEVAEQAALFSRAVIQLVEQLPDPVDVYHCNEWTSAMVPFFLRTRSASDTAVVYTVHNLNHEGGVRYNSFTGDKVDLMNQAVESLGLEGIAQDQIDGLVTYKSKSGFLTMGLIRGGTGFADRVNTVSHSYGEHIGCPGIQNGLDVMNWSPEAALGCDPGNLDDVLRAKARRKSEVQKKYGLEENPDVVLISYLHRYCEQKRTDEFVYALPILLRANPNLQVIMRGGFEAGNKDHFWKLRNILDKAPKLERRLSFSPSFSSDEARIYAASDFLYMLSMDEPFGYSAVKAMTVGAIPIVTHVGGLKDIVIPIDLSGEGNGVVVSVSDSDRYVPNGGYDSTRTDVVPFQIFGATSQALMLHQNEQLRRQAVASGLSFDYLWEGKDGKGPVVQYEQLFHEAIAARKG